MQSKDAAGHKAKSKERYQKYHYEGGGRERNAERQRERKKSDPLFALKCRVGNLIRISIRGHGYTKRSKTYAILGCTFEFFAAHIERQFLPGMSWENRHLWHIDHIVPMATAVTEADVLALNHFTNMRPLWGKDNLAKSDSIQFLL